MLPFDILVDLLKILSLRELSTLQSLYWPLQSQIKTELIKRAKEGLQCGAAIYITIPTTLDTLGSLYRFCNPVSTPTLHIAFRYVAFMGGGLTYGNGTYMLKPWKSNYAGYEGWDGGDDPRPLADIQKLYFTFPDTIDNDYSFVCAYDKGDSKSVFPPISPDGIQHLYLNQLSLADVFCIEARDIEWMLKTDNTLPQDRKWKLEYPLQRLQQLQFDFYITESDGEWRDCPFCHKWSFVGFDLTEGITVFPKSGKWLYDEEDKEQVFKDAKWMVENWGSFGESDFCTCYLSDDGKSFWVEFLEKVGYGRSSCT
jgi:hypothetical protein